MNIISYLPLPVRKLLLKGQAYSMYEKACAEADAAHAADPKGHRYFVLPTKSGDIKVTTADEETRARRNVATPSFRNVRKPYKLRRQSFYFTPSGLCKQKYQPQGMQPFEVEEHRKMFIEWYFRHH